ncbi:zinc finger protein 83-like [Galleria mellonella]|uniref:Zinc finger protein 83-like n=1 Tax=Galleria mellonella TaxID=7137 RepID=A0ABM3MRB8_GALME|nr:zinc finger protein 83-like [Galleria mellonella]
MSGDSQLRSVSTVHGRSNIAMGNTQSKNLHASDNTKQRMTPYSCDVCSKCFNRKSTLQQHLLIHTGENPYSCDRHLIIHTGDKPYSCDECSKCFSQKAHLTQHLLIHTSDKPYCCDVYE